MEEQVLPVQEDNSNPIPEDKLSATEDIAQMKEDIAYLKDLFVRRLLDDKQKNAAIQKLIDGVSFTFVEPFLHDIILLLDRLEKSDDDFVMSVAEELYDIINRRGVEKIPETSHFDPALHKAVKVVVAPDASANYIVGVIRKGYLFSGKVLRPTEVIVGQSEIILNEEE